MLARAARQDTAVGVAERMGSFAVGGTALTVGTGLETVVGERPVAGSEIEWWEGHPVRIV